MKRIVFIVCLLLVAFSTGVFAQGTTMSIGSVTAQVGQSVNVPINVTNFTNVGAISLSITYNPTVLTFTGVANAPSGVTFVAGASGGLLSVGWFDATTTSPINIASGKLVDLVFTYNGGNSQLVFNTSSCEITTDSAPPTTIPVSFSSGVVGALSVKLTLGTVNAAKGSVVSVPINAENFNKIGSVSLKINYDPTVLTFDSTAHAPAGFSFTVGAAGGVLSLGWFDATGLGKSIGNAKLVDLVFNYASGASNLTFQTSQCEVADSSASPVGVTYVNGAVLPLPSEAVSVTLDSTAYAAGTTFLMPLNVRNFKSVGAISLKIRYNAAVLTFNGVSNTFRTAFTVNANAGILSIAWFSAGPVTPITLTGKLMDISFTYNGGTSALEFQTAQCEISDSTAAVVEGILYKNGNVTLFTPTAGWAYQTSGISTDLFSVKAVSQSVAWAAGAGGRVLRTVNGGYSWTSVGGGAIGTADIYNIEAISGDVALVTTTPSATYIYRTTDGGTTWAQVFTLAGGFIDGIKMFDANNGMALGDPVGGKWTVLKTSDGGATWARIATEPAQVGGEAGANNGLAVIGSSNIWFTGLSATREVVYRSTDGGATWASAALPFPNNSFTPGIWFNNTKYGFVTAGSAGAAITADGGATWSKYGTLGGSGSFYGVWGVLRDVWLTRGSTILRSTNEGATFGISPEFTGTTGTWQNIYGATNPTVTSATVWAVSLGGGIGSGFFATITDVGGPGTPQVPATFSLAQNYPNPFNPSTRIEYSLPHRSDVTLRIYDMLGQEVRTLATGVQEAGQFTVVWDGRNNLGNTVSTGMYLYRIEASPLDGGNTFTSFKKMLLLK